MFKITLSIERSKKPRPKTKWEKLGELPGWKLAELAQKQHPHPGPRPGGK